MGMWRKRFPTNITDLIEVVAALVPGDKDEYLTCMDHGKAHERLPWTEDSPSECSVCGAEIAVHMPRSERWPLIYILKRQKIFPYRLYTFGEKPATGRWVWRDRTLYEWEREDPWSLKEVLDDALDGDGTKDSGGEQTRGRDDAGTDGSG